MTCTTITNVCVSLSAETITMTLRTRSFMVKVQRAKLSACFTCLLCDKLFRNATTISECLHTFCRECINKKLIDENLQHCPVCKADLGCSPLDKLRGDHSLQYLREKIFPCEGKNAKVPQNGASVRPKRKKKNSLSSLKAKARRAKAAAREASTPQEPVRSASTPQEPVLSASTPQEPVLSASTPQEPVLSASTPQEPELSASIPQESELSASKPDKVEDVSQGTKQCGINILDEVSTIQSARRAKAAARRKFIRCELTPTSQPDKVVTEDKKKDDDPLQLETSSETSNTRVQNSSEPDSSQQIEPNKISGERTELWNENVDVHEPLKCIVEAASKKKSRIKSTMQENGVIPLLVDSSDNDSQVSEVEVKTHCHQINNSGDQNEFPPPKLNTFDLNQLHITEERTAKISEDLNVPAQPEIDLNSESSKAFGPIWFSLVASQEKEVGARLPQISSCYIRVRDGSLPVSFIKKYLVKKLYLASETEVEISLQGQPVLSSWQLQNLVDFWLQTVPANERIQTSIGSSAKDFVMVLKYSRKT